MEHPITISSRGKLYKSERIRFFDQLVQKARQQIMEQEDAELFKALDAAAKEE